MERKATGIGGLDEMLLGGFFPETANLIEGAPGTGKTTIGMQFIYHGITACQEPGLILTFEEFPQQYYRDAASFGWDLRALEAQNKLRVIMTSPEVTRADLKQVGGLLEHQASEINAQRVLVDSISHFERTTDNRYELREAVFEFINGLKRLGLTAILTRESTTVLGGDPNVGHDLAYVADSYIVLRFVEIASAMRKALLVFKLRGSDHAKDICQFEITGQGVVVQAKFEGQQGIMSGSPVPTMAEAFNKAFGPSRGSRAK